MSNGKLFQSFGAATLTAREVEDNFVRLTTSKYSSTHCLVYSSDVEVHQNNELNMSTVQP